MSKILKIGLIAVVVVMLLVAITLWYPYNVGEVPEWRLQIVDSTGQPVAGAQANEEWLDPLEEGHTMADTAHSDSNGLVVFPKRVLHNRLASGPPQYPPTSRIFVCGQNRYGEVMWDQGQGLITRLKLKPGACPYM